MRTFSRESYSRLRDIGGGEGQGGGIIHIHTQVQQKNALSSMRTSSKVLRRLRERRIILNKEICSRSKGTIFKG